MQVYALTSIADRSKIFMKNYEGAFGYSLVGDFNSKVGRSKGEIIVIGPYSCEDQNE